MPTQCEKLIQVKIEAIICLLMCCVIASCAEFKEPHTTFQTEIVCLQGFRNEKELTVKFPFIVIRQEGFGICTWDEPICDEYHNDSLEIRICHKYLKPFEWPMRKNKSELINVVNESLNGSIADEAKLFRAESTFRYLPKIIDKTNHLEFTKSGFIIEWPEKSLFVDEYLWLNNKEYLGIEFRKYSNSQIADSYYEKEIKYIVKNIEGKPVHNRVDGPTSDN